MRRSLAVTALLLLTVVAFAFAQQSGSIGQLRGFTNSTGELQTSSAGDTALLTSVKAAVESLQSDVASGYTLETYLSTGAGDAEDENEIDANSGVLMGISAYNNHASANAFIKCSNLTAANTTVASSAVFYQIMVPFGGGYVDRNINATYSVALTCSIVLGEAATDEAEVAANDVGYNITTR